MESKLLSFFLTMESPMIKAATTTPAVKTEATRKINPLPILSGIIIPPICKLQLNTINLLLIKSIDMRENAYVLQI